jgi:hypothetical protein
MPPSRAIGSVFGPKLLLGRFEVMGEEIAIP